MDFFITGSIAIIVIFLIGFVMIKSGEWAEEKNEKKRLEKAQKADWEYLHGDEKPRD